MRPNLVRVQATLIDELSINSITDGLTPDIII